MFRRRRSSDRPRPPAVPAVSPRWQPRVDEVMAARDRFHHLVAATAGGPTRSRLEELAGQVDAAVRSCVDIVDRAQRLEAAVAELEPERLGAELKAARRRLGSGDDELVQTEVRSLAAQHAAANRLWNELDECERRLRLIDLRLDEAVARSAELLLGRGSALAAVDAMGGELQAVVDDLAALQAGLDEVG